jgi:hypothetical protein
MSDHWAASGPCPAEVLKKILTLKWSPQQFGHLRMSLRLIVDPERAEPGTKRLESVPSFGHRALA